MTKFYYSYRDYQDETDQEEDELNALDYDLWLKPEKGREKKSKLKVTFIIFTKFKK